MNKKYKYKYSPYDIEKDRLASRILAIAMGIILVLLGVGLWIL